MSIFADTSLDMPTINEPVSATQVVKSPDVTKFEDIQNPRYMVFAPQDGPNEADVDVSSADDVNNLSFSDFSNGLSNLGNKVKEFGNSALEHVGLINKDPKIQPLSMNQKPEEVKPSEPNKLPPTQKPLNEVVNAGNFNPALKELQTYFKSPDANLKILLQGKVYNGPIDGKINNELRAVAAVLEGSIASVIDNKAVYGTVLKTDPNDIKAAISKVIAYKNYLNDKKLSKMNIDERFYKLAQLLKK
jgi:hypothetical protein